MSSPSKLHTTVWALVLFLLGLWSLFAVVYIATDIQQTVNATQATTAQAQQTGAQAGRLAAVTEVMQLGAKCEPVTLSLGEGDSQQTMILWNTACPVPQQAPVAPAGGEAPPTE